MRGVRTSIPSCSARPCTAVLRSALPRPAGRGKADRKTAVHERADALGIPVYTPKSLRKEAAQAEFAAHDADLAVVAAYGLILPKPILDAPRGGWA